MIYNYCTLFNIGYIDRGRVMAESLQKCTNDYHLYILAMDDKTFEVFSTMKMPNVTVVSLDEYEDETLRGLRQSRSMREYCWTSSSSFLYYLMNERGLDNCTYIDADMYFYSSPNSLVDEIIQADCSIGIIRHDFPENWEGRSFTEAGGPYCVEFNTFLKNDTAMTALKWWKDKCIDNCAETSDNKVFGDQLYLKDWTERFAGVYVHSNKGAGMAPWNIMNYKYAENGTDIVYRKTGSVIKPVFYHMHNLYLMDDSTAKISVSSRAGKKDWKLINDFYSEYLMHLKENRKYLIDNFGISWDSTNVTSTEEQGKLRRILGELAVHPVNFCRKQYWKKDKRKDYISY